MSENIQTRKEDIHKIHEPHVFKVVGRGGVSAPRFGH